MLEKKIEEKLKDEVKKAGGRAYKFVSPGNTGVPDRMIVMPNGCVGFVEVKQKGKVPTKLQDLQIRRLKEFGCYVAVLDDIQDIPKIIQDIQRGKDS